MNEQSAPETPQTSRRGGRAARRAERAQADVEAQASAPAYVTRKIPLTELCSDKGLGIIEANAETILEEIGIDFKDDEEVLQIWKDAGADVDGERVRFPKGLARSLLATAPAQFTQVARTLFSRRSTARRLSMIWTAAGVTGPLRISRTS